MSGEFITLADARIITGRAAPGTNAFIVDLQNLQLYMGITGADQIMVQSGINDDGSETLVITCYKQGGPVYHMDGSGNQCVLEHIYPPTQPPLK